MSNINILCTSVPLHLRFFLYEGRAWWSFQMYTDYVVFKKERFFGNLHVDFSCFLCFTRKKTGDVSTQAILGSISWRHWSG